MSHFKTQDHLNFVSQLGTLFVQSTHGFYRRYGKRALDVTLIVLFAPVVFFILFVLCILGSLDGGSPFYAQERLGKRNKVFRLYKLRSMFKDSDRVLKDILDTDPEAAAYWAKHQKLRPDPRITRVGHVSRKTSFDELPQLWNVLRGEMSLVGPRPMMPHQKDLYAGHDYVKQRPGLTGLWQVSERANSSFAERAAFDSAYYETMSFKNDIKIILKTFCVVLACSGE